MITSEIISYIKQQLANGVSRDQISVSLKQNGWNDSDILEAFNAVSSSANNVPKAPLNAQSSHAHKLRNFAIAIVILVLLGGAGWWFLKNRPSPNTQNQNLSSNIEIPATQTENFDDLKVTYEIVPVEENSVVIFNTISKDAISKEDSDFLYESFKDYPPISSIPLANSKKIVSKYKNVLATFEAGVDKKYYQCFIMIKENCQLQVLRNISKLVALNSIILFKDGKVIDAQDYAKKIIKLGQMLTASNEDIITILVGWELQRMGYHTLSQIQSTTPLSTNDKNILINNLREEHKKLFKFIFLDRIEAIDYITDINKKPSRTLDEDEEDMLNNYRTVANSTTWKPDVVKKWFYDSLKTELLNIDLPCDSELVKSGKIDIGFDPENPMPEKTENFAGKAFYSMVYSSLSSANTKRCEVEKLINAL